MVKTKLKIGFLIFFYGMVSIAFSQQNFKNDKYVMVLDVQQYWTDKAMSEKKSAEMLSAINALIGITNPDKIIYIKTGEVARVLSITWNGFKIDTLYADAFDSRLTIASNLIFEKYNGDAFTSTELETYLSEQNAKEIIVTGLLAEKCVQSTVLGGLLRGYKIFVLPEAIGSKSKHRKQKMLSEIENKGCILLNMSDL